MRHLTAEELNGLVKEAKDGNETAFSRIFEATYHAQYFTAFSILNNRTVAEDAVQIAYLRAYQNLNSLERPESFLPWLSKITYHSCLNIRRKQEKVIANLDEELVARMPDPDVSSDPVETAMQGERRELILRVLSRLSEEHRAVIVMKYFQNLKYREIAGFLDCSSGTVKSRIHYALKQLRLALREEGCQEIKSLPAFAPAAIWSKMLYGKSGASLRMKNAWKTACAVILAGMILVGADLLLAPASFDKVNIAAAASYTKDVSQIDVQLNRISGCTLSAFYENGQSLPVNRTGKKKFKVRAIRNGKVNLLLMKGNRVLDRGEIDVRNIDSDPPILTSWSVSGNSLNFIFSDDVSGLRLDSLKARFTNGKRIPVKAISQEKGQVTLPLIMDESISLTIQDRAGNKRTYDVTPEK